MKLNFFFLVAGMPFDGETLEKSSLGGSETAGLCLAREIAALGHTVHMFCSTERSGKWDGVEYHPASLFLPAATRTPSDVVVVQRAPDVFTNSFASKVNILWQHDLALARHVETFSGTTWNVDRIALLSGYMVEQYKKALNLPESTIFQTRNGIDLKLFPEPHERNSKRLIYSARPERGLDMLVTRIMPELLRRDPEIKLAICGYDNHVPQMEDFYAQIAQQAQAVGAYYLGNLTKRELYQEYAKSGVYVYPTPSPVMPNFNEISCITAMECQAAGLPIVTSMRGALPETIAEGAGTLIDGDPWDDEYVDIFCDAVMKYVENHSEADYAGSVGMAEARAMDWSGIADEWVNECRKVITEKNDDPVRLAKHMMRRSDVIAAEAAVEGMNTVGAQSVRHEIEKDYGWRNDRDAFIDHYKLIGPTHDGSWQDHSETPRFAATAKFVASKSPGCVIDFGCAYGFHTIPLANLLPNTRFIGVDIETASLNYARQYAKETETAVAFHEADESWMPEEKADGVILGEILEHVPEPWELLRKAVSWVKPGGWIYFTVPYGPWEEMSYHTYPYRCHIWEISQADIEEMIGNQADLALDVMPAGVNEHDNQPLGWFVGSFTVSDQAIGKIDMGRKLWIQAPRETLSVNMIAGPGVETTLAWCLDSVRFIADEIVIGDCGMSAEAKQIALRYGARIVQAPDPNLSGFETPRNIVLGESKYDWVLWIDTDERLINPRLLPKYLRKNNWNGYGIRQHHFSADAEFKPDMPIRLFRRAAHEGKTIRFYGCIHEHPELELNKGPGPIIVLSDVHIAHIGYLSEDIRQRRFMRNQPLLKMDMERYPDRLLQKHFICRDNMLMAGWLLRQNGGRVTAEIQSLCEEAITLYKKHFLGMPNYVNMDTQQYYSDALRCLGRGVDVQFDIQAAKDGQGAPINGGSMRFDSEEEVIQEVEWRARQAVGRFYSEHW